MVTQGPCAPSCPSAVGRYPRIASAAGGDSRTRFTTYFAGERRRAARIRLGYSMFVSASLRVKFALAMGLALGAWPFESSRADVPVAADSRDVALLSRMTLAEKVNQLMLLSKGTMTGPDSAGRPNKSAEELAREGIGFQMSAFEWSTADANRIQRIALKESKLGIPLVFATDIIHGYWTVFPVPLGLAATFDPADARVVAEISGLEGY